MKKSLYLGIDVGGTFIKGAITDSDGNILVKDKAPTETQRLAECILDLSDRLTEKAQLSYSDILGMGIGIPGLVDTQRGLIVTAENLSLRGYPIVEKITQRLNMPVKLANDANVATLGEMLWGVGKNYKSAVMLTLGTGVGGGVVIDGVLFEGNLGAGAELGHTVIAVDGEPCSCGRRGCLEAYASATALIRQTKRAMQNNPSSLLWEIGSLDAVTGKTAFDYAEKCPEAKSVVDSYVRYLTHGIANFINVFRPEAIILGGGVCAQGEALLSPIREMLKGEIFAYGLSPEVDVLVASLGNDAGCLGASALLHNA